MKQLSYIILLVLVAGCKEKYESPVHSPVTGYLVVDGIVNSGAGQTTIKLSRTTKFDNRNMVYEKGAQVKLEGENNIQYVFSETTPGIYLVNGLNLDPFKKYRLRITAAGKEYASDYVPVNKTPPIDSLSWRQENDGIQIYVNAHDSLNRTHYYQWIYDETWELHSPYISSLKYKIVQNPGRGYTYSVVYRDSTTFSYDPSIATCWQSNNPSNLLLSSTASLSKDIIFLPIAFIPPASVELSVLYSLHVQQYSWTKDGYAFLERMKKNTESTGTIFDPQPSNLNGNIRCLSDPTEPVIGYVNLCSTQEKRIFIRRSDVPSWGYRTGCYDFEIQNASDSILAKGLGFTPTVPGQSGPLGGIASFYAALPECVDCTLRGTNKKPSYWP